MKGGLKILLPIVVLGLAAFGFYRVRSQNDLPFRYAGTLEATRVDIPARVATVISAFTVDEGQKVSQGEKIASLACEDIKIAADLAESNFKRAEKLHRSGTMSDEVFDRIASNKRESDTRLKWCEVTSPLSGRVLTKYLEEGEWAYPGAKLLAVADLSDIWAYFYVPQEVMSKLKVGSKVTGYIPELGQKQFAGIIRKINDEAEFTPKNVQTQKERTRLVFGIKIAFDNPTEDLKPGMTMEVALE